MEAEPCNTTMTVRLESRIPLTMFNVIGLIGSIFLLVVFTRTPTLKSFSGLLLTHEQVLCFLEQLSGMALLSNQGHRIMWLDATLLCFIHVIKNISLFLMLAINVNLYIAIFKATSYTAIITRSRGVKIIIFSWIICCSYGFAPLMYKDYYRINCFFFYTAPVPTPSTFWLPILYTAQALGSLVANLVFVCIFARRRLPTNDRMMADTKQKIRLCKFILTISTAYSLTVLAFYPAMYFQNTLSAMGKSVITLFVVYLNKVYLNLRVCFYLPLYQPLRETAKNLCCRKRSTLVKPIDTVSSTVGEVG